MTKQLKKIVALGALATGLAAVTAQPQLAQTNRSLLELTPPRYPGPWTNRPPYTNKPTPLAYTNRVTVFTNRSLLELTPPRYPGPWTNRPPYTNKPGPPYTNRMIPGPNPVRPYTNPAPPFANPLPVNPPTEQRPFDNGIQPANPTPGNPRPVNPNQRGNRVFPANPTPNNPARPVTPPPATPPPR